MINRNRGTFRAGLPGINVDIDYNNDEARAFLDFLLGDMPGGDAPLSGRKFDLLIVGRPARMSLWIDDKQLYFGESRYSLAYILVNELVYECIVNNHQLHALHAAALAYQDRGILLVGKSGSGKSSLAAWLTAKGGTYLSDELVLVSEEHLLHPFVRPLSLTSATFESLARHIAIDPADCLVDSRGAMLPHRALNLRWSRATPSLAAIIHPEFIEGHPAELTGLSSARSCLKLLECHVNARSIPDHGFGRLAEITRQVDSYQLRFGGFDGLMELLQPVLTGTR